MGTYLFIHNSTHKILLYLHPDPLSIQLSNSLINFWILSCTIWAISLVLNAAINDVFKLRIHTFTNMLLTDRDYESPLRCRRRRQLTVTMATPVITVLLSSRHCNQQCQGTTSLFRKLTSSHDLTK